MPSSLDQIVRLMWRAPDLDAGLNLLRDTAAAVGMDLPAVIDDVAGNTPSRDAEGRAINERLGWPAWMIKGWYGRAYTRQHPIYLRCRFETMPFAIVNAAMWGAPDTLTAAQQHMRRDMEAVGLYGSIVVPVHLSHSRVGAINWATTRPRDLNAILAEAGHLLFATAHGFMRLLQPASRPRIEAGDLSHLTDRQIDCLYWLAAGKTIAETAIILDISGHTVREHLRAVTARLGASNTTHAVALACQFGLLGPLR
ncbi:MAG: hypothetical protein GC201_14465 [Alphaproteobacteria bacterium]|nr:hypothetical protein [Alphaproteobacteria bacterium]